MNLDGSFDVVEAIRYLDLELSKLKVQVAGTRPSATMDTPHKGAYFGPAINQGLHEALWKAGYTTIESIRNASDAELLAVKGVGKGTLRLLKAAV